MTQPLCRYCGKKIAKRTRVVFFGHSREDRTKDNWIELTEKPRTREEAQRLVNAQIVSVRWTKGGEGFDYIHQAFTWDGKSYADPYFCTDTHARQFGYVLAENGHATQAYQNAKEKALANSI